MTLISFDADAHDLTELQDALDSFANFLVGYMGGDARHPYNTRVEKIRALSERVSKAALAAIERERAGSPHPPTVRHSIETIVQHYKNSRILRKPISPYETAATILAVYLQGGDPDKPRVILTDGL